MRTWQFPSDAALREFVEAVEAAGDDTAYTAEWVAGTVMTLVAPTDDFLRLAESQGAWEITGRETQEFESQGRMTEQQEPPNPDLEPRPAPWRRPAPSRERPTTLSRTVVGAWRALTRRRR